MLLQFGSDEATRLLELTGSGAERVEVYRNFVAIGASRCSGILSSIGHDELTQMQTRLLELEMCGQSLSVVAQQAFYYGALTTVLNELLTNQADQLATNLLQEFLTEHSVLTEAEFVEGMDQLIAEARRSGASEADIARMEAKRNDMAELAAELASEHT